jgi:hypothetical protein
MLHDVMWWLRHKDHELYKTSGIRRYWIITAAEEFFHEVKSQINVYRGLKPSTVDFTSMYTMLTHESIFANMREAVQEAVSYKHTYQSNNHGFNAHNLASFQDIMTLLEFVVRNTYFSNDSSRVIHQHVGLPMGTNAAPEIANLTFYIYERDFVDNLINSGHRALAQQYSLSCRFIDDAIHWNAPPPLSVVYNNLEFTQHSLTATSTVFLGAKTDTFENGHVELSVFDKSLEWNVPVIKFPHGNSNAPVHQSYGVTLGQLKRFRTICTTHEGYKRATAQFCQRMLQRQHPVPDLKKAFRIHLFAHSSDKYTHHTMSGWFNRMISWVINHLDQQPHNKVSLLATEPTLLQATANTAADGADMGGVPDSLQSPAPSDCSEDTQLSLTPPNDEPYSEKLFKYCRAEKNTIYETLDSDAKLDLRRTHDLVEKKEKKGGGKVKPSVCEHCWQSFDSMKTHQQAPAACERAHRLRSLLLPLYHDAINAASISRSLPFHSHSSNNNYISSSNNNSNNNSSSSNSSNSFNSSSSSSHTNNNNIPNIYPVTSNPQHNSTSPPTDPISTSTTSSSSSSSSSLQYFPPLFTRKQKKAVDFFDSLPFADHNN